MSKPTFKNIWNIMMKNTHEIKYLPQTYRYLMQNFLLFFSLFPNVILLCPQCCCLVGFQKCHVNWLAGLHRLLRRGLSCSLITWLNTPVRKYRHHLLSPLVFPKHSWWDHNNHLLSLLWASHKCIIFTLFTMLFTNLRELSETVTEFVIYLFFMQLEFVVD